MITVCIPAPMHFFADHTQQIFKVKSFLYSHLFRKMMTRNVDRMRGSLLLQDKGDS